MRKKRDTTVWNDPDDAPELTPEFFARADYYVGDKLIKRGRGRPKLESPKEQVTLRLDADVIKAIRSSGPMWSRRVNEVLSRSVRTGQFKTLKVVKPAKRKVAKR